MHRVFVYGTLRRGQPNYYLLENSTNGHREFKGLGSTLSTFPLVISTRFNIPFLLNAPNAERALNVKGEIYEVDDQMLSVLDKLERHPEFYERVKIDIKVDNSNLQENKGKTPEIQRCWTYLIKNYRPELLKLPFLEEFDAYGSHGLKYVGPSDRERVDPEVFWLEVKTKVQMVSSQ